MDIVKPIPIETPIDFAAWPASKTLAMLLGKDNQLVYYMGESTKTTMSLTSFAEIGKVILKNSAFVAKAHNDNWDKDMYVIIKPTSGSVYRNFVDILDEMNINKISTYAIDDKYLLADETSFMKKMEIY